MNIYYDLERSCSKRETSYFILLEILVLKEILLNWIYYVPLGKKVTVTCFHKSGGSCYSVGGGNGRQKRIWVVQGGDRIRNLTDTTSDLLSLTHLLVQLPQKQPARYGLRLTSHRLTAPFLMRALMASRVSPQDFPINSLWEL